MPAKLTPNDRNTLEAFAQALSDHSGKPMPERAKAIHEQMDVHLERLPPPLTVKFEPALGHVYYQLGDNVYPRVRVKLTTLWGEASGPWPCPDEGVIRVHTCPSATQSIGNMRLWRSYGKDLDEALRWLVRQRSA